jgi:hypothetical protein
MRSFCSSKPSLLLVFFASSSLFSLGCDDGPSVSTDETGAAGAGANTSGGTAGSTSSTGGGGGSAGTASGGVGGDAGVGGTVSGGGGGGGGGGVGGDAGVGGTASGGCEGPSPAGCISTGCDDGSVCTPTSGVCVPSTCFCGQNGEWACSEDCGGGICIPPNEKGQYAVRFGFSSGQQSIRDFCVAYDLDAKGEPVMDPSGLLLSHFTSPEPFAKLEQITRYIELTRRPIAFGFTSDGDCAHLQGIVPLPAAAPYQTVFAVPLSGEAMQLWSVVDAGPSDAPVVSPRLRIVNALLDSQAVTAVATAGGEASLGLIPFGTASGYVELPSSSLLTIDFTRADGSAWRLNFGAFDTINVARTTVILRGTGASTQALVCEDTTPEKDPLGGDPPDVFSSACLLVNAASAVE